MGRRRWEAFFFVVIVVAAAVFVAIDVVEERREEEEDGRSRKAFQAFIGILVIQNREDMRQREISATGLLLWGGRRRHRFEGK